MRQQGNGIQIAILGAVLRYIDALVFPVGHTAPVIGKGEMLTERTVQRVRVGMSVEPTHKGRKIGFCLIVGHRVRYLNVSRTGEVTAVGGPAWVPEDDIPMHADGVKFLNQRKQAGNCRFARTTGEIDDGIGE